MAPAVEGKRSQFNFAVGVEWKQPPNHSLQRRRGPGPLTGSL